MEEGGLGTPFKIYEILWKYLVTSAWNVNERFLKKENNARSNE